MTKAKGCTRIERCTSVDYDHIGNAEGWGNYAKELASPHVEQLGFVISPYLVLKMYTVGKHSKVYENFDKACGINELRKFLKPIIKQGVFVNDVGLGFGIYLREPRRPLTIATWNSFHPYLLNKKVYEKGLHSDSFSFSHSSRGGSGIFNGFDLEELDVVNHERLAWLRFLNSKRTKEDKIQYLDDFFKGE